MTLCMMHISTTQRQSLFSGMDYWNGLLECPLTLNLTIIEPIRVWNCVAECPQPTQTSKNVHGHNSLMKNYPLLERRF